MMRKQIILTTEKAPAAIGPYSQGVILGDLLYTSGQIALDPVSGTMVGTTIQEQAKQVMENLGAILEAAGSSFDHVVKTTCFLVNMQDFAEFNQVYGTYISNAPARSCVAVKELPKGALCEVEVIALV